VTTKAAFYQPETNENLRLLSVNVVSVIQYLKWTSLILLYEKVTGMYAGM